MALVAGVVRHLSLGRWKFVASGALYLRISCTSIKPEPVPHYNPAPRVTVNLNRQRSAFFLQAAAWNLICSRSRSFMIISRPGFIAVPIFPSLQQAVSTTNTNHQALDLANRKGGGKRVPLIHRAPCHACEQPRTAPCGSVLGASRPFYRPAKSARDPAANAS